MIKKIIFAVGFFLVNVPAITTPQKISAWFYPMTKYADRAILKKFGQRITYLGDAFSEETGGERKHLHFGIHKGIDLYFLGHEQTKEDLNLNWEDPTKFLRAKGAVEIK
jgi:hypothetical protein